MAKWHEDMAQAESDARFATQAGAGVSKTPASNTNPTFEDAVNAAVNTADTTDQTPPVQYADASNQTGVMTDAVKDDDSDDGQVNPDQSFEDTPYAHDYVFWHLRNGLKPREGGYVDDPDDDGGATNKGISQELLNLLHENGYGEGLPEKSIDLTDRQINDITHDHFYKRPKIDELFAIARENKEAQKLVEHVFDAGFMGTTTTVGSWFQEAMDEAFGTDLKTKRKGGPSFYDGIIGPKTRDVFRRTVENGKLDEISQKFAQKRLAYLRKHPDFWKYGKGWEKRIKSFLE